MKENSLIVLLVAVAAAIVGAAVAGEPLGADVTIGTGARTGVGKKRRWREKGVGMFDHFHFIMTDNRATAIHQQHSAHTESY